MYSPGHGIGARDVCIHPTPWFPQPFLPSPKVLSILSASLALPNKSRSSRLPFKLPHLKDQTQNFPNTDSPLTLSRPYSFCGFPVAIGASLSHFLTQNGQRQPSSMGLFLEQPVPMALGPVSLGSFFSLCL